MEGHFGAMPDIFCLDGSMKDSMCLVPNLSFRFVTHCRRNMQFLNQYLGDFFTLAKCTIALNKIKVAIFVTGAMNSQVTTFHLHGWARM